MLHCFVLCSVVLCDVMRFTNVYILVDKDMQSQWSLYFSFVAFMKDETIVHQHYSTLLLMIFITCVKCFNVLGGGNFVCWIQKCGQFCPECVWRGAVVVVLSI